MSGAAIGLAQQALNEIDALELADAAIGDRIAATESRSATLEGANTGVSLTKNSRFNQYSAATGTPDFWKDGTSGVSSLFTRVANENGGYALRINGPAGGNAYTAQYGPVGQIKTGMWAVLEVDWTLEEGTNQGSAILLRTRNAAKTTFTDYRISLVDELDVNNSPIGLGTVGQTYRVRKLVQFTSSVNNSVLETFVMAHWTTIGSVATANSLTFHNVTVRPATQTEINLKRVDDSVVVLQSQAATTQPEGVGPVSASSYTNSSNGGFDVPDFPSSNIVKNASNETYLNLNTNGFYASWKRYIPVLPGRTYRFTIDVEPITAPAQVTMFPRFLNTDGSSVGTISSYTFTTTGRTTLTWERTWTAAQLADKVWMRPALRSNDTSGIKLYSMIVEDVTSINSKVRFEPIEGGSTYQNFTLLTDEYGNLSVAPDAAATTGVAPVLKNFLAYDVSRAGCRGNNAAHDTPIILGLIEKIRLAGGGILVFPAWPTAWRINQPLPVWDNMTVIGMGYVTETTTLQSKGMPKLVFEGSGEGCFVNGNPNAGINGCGFHNLTIMTHYDAQYEWIMKLDGLIGSKFNDNTLENKWAGGGCLRSLQVNDAVAWANSFARNKFKAVDGGSHWTIDIQLGTSPFMGGTVRGGAGVRCAPCGYMSFAGGLRFDTASYANLCIVKKGDKNSAFSVIGCQFERAMKYSILIDVDDFVPMSGGNGGAGGGEEDPGDDEDQGGTKYNLTRPAYNMAIIGNHFRGLGGMLGGEVDPCEIMFKNDGGTQVTGAGLISGNTFMVRTTAPIRYDYTKWKNVQFVANIYLQDLSVPSKDGVAYLSQDPGALIVENALIQTAGPIISKARSTLVTDGSNPTISFSTSLGNFTYTSTLWRVTYNQIGNRLFFDIALTFTPTFSTGTGGPTGNFQLTLKDAPLPRFVTGIPVTQIGGINFLSGESGVTAQINSAGLITFNKYRSGASPSAVPFALSSFTSGQPVTLFLNGSYEVA